MTTINFWKRKTPLRSLLKGVKCENMSGFVELLLNFVIFVIQHTGMNEMNGGANHINVNTAYQEADSHHEGRVTIAKVM